MLFLGAKLITLNLRTFETTMDIQLKIKPRVEKISYLPDEKTQTRIHTRDTIVIRSSNNRY